MWPEVINGFGVCYMLNVSLDKVHYSTISLDKVHVKCLCVCIVQLSQPSGGDLVYPLTLWDVYVPEIKMCIKKSAKKKPVIILVG